MQDRLMNYMGGQNIGSGIGNLLNYAMLRGAPKPTNPANSAMPFFNQIPAQLQQYLNPYAQMGQGAMGQMQGQVGQLLGGLGPLQQQYSQLMSDPTAMMNKIGAGYTQSPGYQQALKQSLQAANQSAAAGGMAGTPMAQTNAADIAQQMASRDYGNYMQNALSQYGTGLQGASGLYGAGLQGLSGMNQMGYGASSNLAESLANALASQGNLAFSGNAIQNMMKQGQAGAQAGALSGGIGSLLGGLFGMGNPLSFIGNLFGGGAQGNASLMR